MRRSSSASLADPRLAADLADRRALLSLPQDKAICASVNLNFFMVPSSSSGPNHIRG